MPPPSAMNFARGNFFSQSRGAEITTRKKTRDSGANAKVSFSKYPATATASWTLSRLISSSTRWPKICTPRAAASLT